MEIEPEGIVNDGATGVMTSDIIIHNGFFHAPLLEQANMAWQEREASFRCLYDHCPLGIFRVSLDGTNLAVNAEMARIIGCDTPAEAVRYFNNLTDQFFVNPNRMLEYIALLQKTGAVQGFEFGHC
jgi:PAS domain-containing protein